MVLLLFSFAQDYFCCFSLSRHFIHFTLSISLRASSTAFPINVCLSLQNNERTNKTNHCECCWGNVSGLPHSHCHVTTARHNLACIGRESTTLHLLSYQIE